MDQTYLAGKKEVISCCTPGKRCEKFMKKKVGQIQWVCNISTGESKGVYISRTDRMKLAPDMKTGSTRSLS